ncbi:MAG: ABC-F family ATP-binding cassette domain-containing protein [Bacilli bacterium]
MHLKNLSMSFGTQELFNDINLYLNENEKIGVVGVNGAGKTTLFKIIMGIIEPDNGKVIFDKKERVEWLPQVIEDEVPSADITVLDFLLLGRPIKKLEEELHTVYDKISTESDPNKQKILLNKINNLQYQLEGWDCYKAENILLKIIGGMNISDSLLGQKLRTLSGGQKSKVAFARLLYSKPEIILLDEPTNHLDKESKDYVINYLKNYKGSVFIISHDINFLNQVTTKTLFIDKRTRSIELCNGNYEDFKRQNIEHEKALMKQAEIQANEEKKLLAVINKYATASGKKKKMAQDREKKLEKLLENKIELPHDLKKVNINMSINREGSNIPLKVKDLCFKYNKSLTQNVINNLTFELNKGEKFLIIGQNGIGKSTLLKLIIGELIPDSGKIEVGSKTDIGYYAQEHELLDNERDILNNFSDINISQRQLRTVLGRFLFFGNDVFKKVDVLSPGERSRVALAKLSLKGSNFLILDEPTNHLDPQTQMIIAETFKTFPGTMLVVSHNPDFVDNLGIIRVLVLPIGKRLYYNKDIVEYFKNININKD